MPKDEDVEFLKKQLSERIEENRQKDIRIKQTPGPEKMQLSEVIKKDSFTPANNYKPIPPKKFDFPEPDEYNTFVWKNITFDEFRMKLGPLKARSNSKINVYLERVTESMAFSRSIVVGDMKMRQYTRVFTSTLLYQTSLPSHKKKVK